MDHTFLINDVETFSKLGFPVEIKTRARITPPRLLTGPPTRILKVVEDLRRGLNADIGRKDVFEIASINIYNFDKCL